MIYELDNELIDFLCKYKLTMNQFAIVLLLYKKHQGGTEYNEAMTSIMKLSDQVGRIGNCQIKTSRIDKEGNPIFINEVEDLIDRTIVTRSFGKLHENDIDNFTLNSKLIKALGGSNTEEMFNEFWQAYPKHLLIKNAQVPAKTCDPDDLKEDYIKAIGKKLSNHLLVLEDIKRIREINNNYAQMGIAKYVASKQWEQEETNTNRRVETPLF